MTTVHQAIGSIIADFEGVGKNQRNKEQGYNFRGIDDVLKVLHPLMGTHGVFMVPDVLEREYEERVSKSGTVGHCCHLHVKFTVYGPEGDSVELSTWGEGLDYGDKSTNKAATSAYKYALFELFAVSDPADDADHETPEGGRTESRSASRPATTTRRPPPRPQADPDTGEIPDEFPQNAPRARTEASNGKPVTDAQLRYLTKLQKEHDLSTSDLLVLAGTVTGRTIGASGELTAGEASALIDHLKDPTQKGTT